MEKETSKWEDEYKSTKATGKNVAIEYGTSSLKGVLSSETVNVGGITITNQYFTEALATKKADPLLKAPFDGILGLGNPHDSATRTLSVWESMIRQGKVKKKIFFIWLGRPSLFRKYFFQMSNILVGSKDTNVCSRGCQVFIDSGNSNMDINDSTKLSPDCSNDKKLPDVTFTIAGRSFSVSRRDYIYKVNKNECLSRFVETKDEYWTLCMSFMRAVHTVYD
ncbi:PREDICTED: procardosin-B-like [Camelina sativa]|uniref:Procardosin-B-like n=1 Tax=Camelina sativa TaxID=90675 RepID=A0ABM1QHJ1_CAMSA|nr:PREDICTED: procardosin-B-like [Camelina sativa]